jgi:hypothetical protein
MAIRISLILKVSYISDFICARISENLHVLEKINIYVA